MIKTILVCVLFVFLLPSCQNNEDIQTPDSVSLDVPNYVEKPFYNFKNNPLTKEGIQLGRLLFYDPILSSDSSISCGSCHSQSHAFADHNMKLSIGVKGRSGLRNSPALFNLAWNQSFMWDGGINHIEIMPLAPLTNHLEMDETMPNILLKLNRSPFYKKQFNSFFKQSTINDQQLFYVFAQFMATITSFNSKYDEVKKDQNSFTNSELKGYNLFIKHCNTCHKEPLFTDYSFRNNGLDSSFEDKGRALITLNHSDEGLFKVPSLRNVMLTYPYMHDGRFRYIEDVLNHYANGIKKSKTLDENLTTKISLNTEEKQQIIDFLKTLTDYKLLTRQDISEP